MKPYLLITDGACVKNPGRGGYGTILVTPQGQVREFGGYETHSTNNRMELMSVLKGMQEIYKLAQVEQEGRTIRFISDSKYVLENLENNLQTWARRDWFLASGEEVKNRDIWERVLCGQEELKKLGFEFQYELVKGHSGNEGNERADQIAVKFSRNEPVHLFQGTLEDYPISVESGAAFKPVYLSYVLGTLTRHDTWEECQKAVQGKPNAKFKKVKNSLDERETLKRWGLE